MDIKNIILSHINKNGDIKSSDVVRLCGCSRQAAARHLRELVYAGKIERLHSTRNARYIAAGAAKAAAKRRAADFKYVYPIHGLREELVFREAAVRLGLTGALSPNAYRIVDYAFTEMLNNAIEHSRAEQVRVHARIERGACYFTIADKGVGVFNSIRTKFGLGGDFEAVEHLLKGKQTTAPQQHSGQGIFFTSKIADRFTIESAGLRLVIDNSLPDTLLQEIRRRKGTFVAFALRARSRKDLKALFEQYAHAQYEFDTTRISVKLTAARDENISRSQARRLLFGLDQFKRIILDFNGVTGVGQAFADEIFRVFQRAHPHILIEPQNMCAAVAFMVARARKA